MDINNWGYAEDDLATGHPICKQAPHTDSADDMINGITYGKGWAFLKQLYHLIGYDKFSLATQLYFERFQWKNTVLKDFLSCLDEADDRIGKKTLGLVISKWADTFLNTRGANVLEAKISGDSLVITQTVPEFSDGLRQQKIDVLLFDEDFNETVVTVMSSEEDPEIKVKLPDKKKQYVVLNHGDHAYAKIVLDENTTNFLSSKLNCIKDSLTRSLVWKAIQAMVKTWRVKSTLYFTYIKQNMPTEDSPYLIETVLTTAAGVMGSYVPDECYDDIASEIFDVFYKLLPTKPAYKDSLFNFLRSQAHVEQSVAWLEAGSVLYEGSPIKGCELSKNNKHTILKAVFSKPGFSREEKDRLLKLVVGDDKSDISKNLALSCEALIPDAKSKEKIWKQISDMDSTLSSYERGALMGYFFNRDSAEILKPYYDKYLEAVRAFANCGNRDLMQDFVGHVCPNFSITDSFIESLKKIEAEFKSDDKYDSFCRSNWKNI